MSAHDNDEREASPASSADAPGGGAPPTPPAGGGDSPQTARARRRAWRRVVNRRNAMWTMVVGVVAFVALSLILFIFYRSGRADRIIASRIVSALADYNIRAEIGGFRTAIGPRTAELTDLRLYDATTGAPIGRVERVVATLRFTDLYALRLGRNVDFESLLVEGPEIWVTFDEQGRSNFANIRLPGEGASKRLTFTYETTKVEVRRGLIHYADRLHEISGEARDVRLTAAPENPTAPPESRVYNVAVSMSNSTFVYDGRPVNDIGVEARARVRPRGAEIEEFVLRSPVAEARMTGTLDDWSKLNYKMRATASVDVSQLSNVMKTETTMRGAGRFEGTVEGSGERYRVEGQIHSDALAADGVRLKALNVSFAGGGEGKSYEGQGRAVAELLTAGDFQLSAVQMAGGVTGTGTDFRWLGDLQAAALRTGKTTVAGLILSDAVAELRDNELEAGARRATARSLTSAGATGATTVSGVEATGLTFKGTTDGAGRATVSSARAGQVKTSDATLTNVAASGVTADIDAGGRSVVEVDRVQVGSLAAAGARTGSLNIAGVRLSIYDGRVEGQTNDINVGTVAFRTGDAKRGFTEGRAENVRLARPRFVLEPSGRYRASMDLSLGGGVLGTMPLGTARAAVTATNDAVRLDDFVAEIFGGRASGDATISTARRGTSRVAAEFTGIDIGNLLLVAANQHVPVAGAANGRADLSFPGTNFEAASGTLNAQFAGETGDDARGRTPLNGEVALRADSGVFQVERANLRTASSEVSAAGQFAFEGNSNLRINVASTDASELQRVLVSSGLAPEVVSNIEKYKLGLSGNLSFAGTLTGRLKNPIINGRLTLDSLRANNRDLGALTVALTSDQDLLRVTEGRLQERDGGGVTFTASVPRAGENNITLDATLERFNAGNLVAAFSSEKEGTATAERVAGMGDASGTINVRGLPGAASGNANLRVGPGQIGGEPLEELVARATFSGSEVSLDELNARFRSGTITAKGSLGLGILDPEGGGNQKFDLRASGNNVRLDLLTNLFGGGRQLPPVSGIADFTATASGDFLKPQSYSVEINATGRDVNINGRPAGKLTLVGTTTSDKRFNLTLTTGIFGQQDQIVRAQVNLADADLPATFETTFTNTDLTQLFATLIPSGDVRVTGRVSGSVTGETTIMGDEGLLSDAGLGALRGKAEFSELVLNVNDTPLTAEQPLIVNFTPNEITFTRTRFTGPDTNILFGGTMALREGGRQDLTVNGQLNLRVINRLSPNIITSGVARVGVRVFGTFADPQITGTAEVERANFTAFVADESLNFTSINGRVRFTANQAQIDTLEGRLGGGRVSLAGGALLEDLRPSQFRLSITADNVTVPFPDEFRSTADARLELRGTADAQLVAGTVNLLRTEYTEDIDLADLIQQRREADITEGTGGDGGGMLGNLQVDLQVEGRDALVVRNNLADIVGSVSLTVRGSAEDPVVSGRVTASRGTLNFRNNRFEVTRAYIDLPPRRGADPYLNIQAESEISGYRPSATITGPLSQPTVSLRSDPPLPQADVVSLILTGRIDSNGEQSASTLAQTGLGTATSLLSETLISNPVRRATDKLFGLNRFEIDPLIAGRGGASPTARLTVGRQISRNLSVTYSTNVTTDQNQVVSVEYRVSDRLSFVAQYQQGAVNNLRTQQNNFNFEIRFRKRF